MSAKSQSSVELGFELRSVAPWHTPSLITSEASKDPNYRTVREVLLGARNSSSANQLVQEAKLITSD